HADLVDAIASAASRGAEISQATADAMSPAVATDAASAAVASSPPVAIAAPPPPATAVEPSTTSAAPSALALAAALDDADASTLLDAEVLADPPPPGPSTLSIITSESPGVALAATRSFELPALTIEPRDALTREPTVIVDAEIAAQAAPPGRAPAPVPAPPTTRHAPRTIAARRRWPRDEQPLTAPARVAGFSPHDLPPLDVLIHRMPGPPVGAHPTWATRRITAPRDLVLPLLVLATMIAALYGIARAMF
ncbi:MAG TPA: hypothetical protein VFP84_10825, partial [Kofleriaceae bacterium]|nr:hypothetical protein [Kofleriaceae bacterium]